MTKINDLAAVLADNVFTFFPLDVERYELNAAMVKLASEEIPVSAYHHENERINSFLLDTESIITASALCASLVSLGVKGLSTLDRDRARRFTASIARTFDGAESFINRNPGADALRTALWWCIISDLEKLEHKVGNCPHKDGRLPI